MVCRKNTKRDGLANYYIKDITIPSAKVLTLFTTPVVLIDKPGCIPTSPEVALDHKFLRLICGTIQLVREGNDAPVDYATDGDLTINYKVAGDGAAVTGALDDIINDGTLGSISIFSTITEAENNAIADIQNQPLTLISTANPTTGNMALRLLLMYEIIDCKYTLQ